MSARVLEEALSFDDVTLVPNVGDEAGCAGGDGWYYDDLAAPANDLVGLQQEEARLPQRIRRIPRRA